MKIALNLKGADELETLLESISQKIFVLREEFDKVKRCKLCLEAKTNQSSDILTTYKISVCPQHETGSVLHRVFIDGEEILGITNFEIYFDLNSIPIVKLGHGDVVVHETLMDEPIYEVLPRYPKVLRKLSELIEE